MDAHQFVWPDETIKIEYYGDTDQYVVCKEEAASKPVRRVVEARELLETLRELLNDETAWRQVTFAGDVQGADVDETVKGRDLDSEIDRMRLEIDALRARVSALEKPWVPPYTPSPQPYTPWWQTGTVTTGSNDAEIIYKGGDDD